MGTGLADLFAARTSLAVMAGIAVLGVGLVVVSQNGSVQSTTPRPVDAGHYRNHCIAAVVEARDYAPILRLAEAAPVDPAVLLPGPPPRLQCVYYLFGDIGAVTFEPICDDPFSAHCVRIVSAVFRGRVLYLNRTMVPQLLVPKIRPPHQPKVKPISQFAAPIAPKREETAPVEVDPIAAPAPR